jgi:uncharacterized membrane protein YfcA
VELGLDLIGLLMVAAFVAGTIDAIAGGGGLITIPALMAAGVPPVQAIATNKLQSTFGTGGAVIAYARKGHVDLRRFAVPALASFVGSAIGAYVLTQVDSSFLAGFLPLLLIGIVIYFATAKRVSDEDRHSRAGPALLVAVVLVIGGYDGFFGPGTGSFFTTALVALFGMGLLRAVAHTKLLNFASNLAGLAVLVLGGHVLWITGFAMGLASIAGGQVGAYSAMRFGAGVARPLLIIVSIALTLALLADPHHPLTATVLSWFG